MNLEINKMHLTNFKGIKDRTIEFSNLMNIEGKNASGKTTLATAYHWLFANTDYDLKSNPNIFPVDIEEGTPSVEIEMLIDDKPVKIRKTQTRKVTESNGTRKVALTNTYSVNEVPMAERDMQKKLSDMGFNFENFSTLTNPNSFLAEKKDAQRKLLFSMASNLTDLEVALKVENVGEAAKMLESYSMDEIRAMQKATLAKINEVYGRKGELLNARIDELELSKTDIDFAEQELNRNLINEKLEKNQDAQRVYNLMNSELDELRKKNMELQFEFSSVKQKEENEKAESERKIRQNRKDVQEKADNLDRVIGQMQSEIKCSENLITVIANEKARLNINLNEAKALVFDEAKTSCPVCGRKYSETKIQSIKSNFEAEKKSKIESIEKILADNEDMLVVKRKQKAETERKLQQAMDELTELEKVLNQPLNALQGNMEEPNPYADKKAELEKQILENQNVMAIKKDSMPNMSVLRAEETELQGQLRDCEIQLSKADANAKIDDRIVELRKQQMIYEQDRANAEKILYQLDEIQKSKNELLTEEINKHFGIVKFVFFTYLKNGSYTETCIATINGKELGSSTNTGLEIKARLDIISGLQKFYNGFYPVFLDGSEALDSTSKSEITMPCQMIYLTVVDNKNLTVKEI